MKLLNVIFMVIAMITMNVSNSQTIPKNNFVEVVSATWSSPDLRAQINFPLYLETNSKNVGVQMKLSSSGLGTNYVDTWISATGFFNGYVPFWICNRDASTSENVNTTGDKYCQTQGQYTWYKPTGALRKINDTIYDIYSSFSSEKNESSVKYVLDVFVIEDSILFKQAGSATDLYHRNVAICYFRVPSGVMPTTISANKNYVFKNRMKMKPFANEKKLSVVVVAYDSLNKKHLNATNSTAIFSEDPQICMVTTDSANKNNIIWKPLSGKGIVYIEKETNVTNIYNVIDSASSSKPRIFIDKNSNASIKPESYRLIYKDTTALFPGFKFSPSNSSAMHKTMHLAINKGTGNDWNLIWSSYVGFPVVSYDIYRRFGSGSWSKIGSVSGNVNSYTDLNVSGSNVAYKISVVSPDACDPNAWARLSSESNIADQNFSRDVKSEQEDLSIQPNPAEHNLILVSNSRAGFIKYYHIKDLTGRLMATNAVNNIQTNIDVSNLKQGTYLVTAFFENGEISKKFVRL